MSTEKYTTDVTYRDWILVIGYSNQFVAYLSPRRVVVSIVILN